MDWVPCKPFLDLDGVIICPACIVNTFVGKGAHLGASRVEMRDYVTTILKSMDFSAVHSFWIFCQISHVARTFFSIASGVSSFACFALAGRSATDVSNRTIDVMISRISPAPEATPRELLTLSIAMLRFWSWSKCAYNNVLLEIYQQGYVVSVGYWEDRSPI